MKIYALGVRGSVPVLGADFQKFGGATSSFLIEALDQAVFIDAGSGIINSPLFADKNISIFLTHPHLDHLLGLPFFPMITERDRTISIYAVKRGGLSAKDQVDAVFAPPIWPVTMEDYPSSIQFYDLPESGHKTLSNISISWIEGNHPGGSTIYKITEGDHSVVIATDYEHSPSSDQTLISFAKGASALIYDGQYTEEEYITKKGYGHSTKEHGLEIGKACEAETVIFTHHNPTHVDGLLMGEETRLQKINHNVFIAKAGDEWTYEGDYQKADN